VNEVRERTIDGIFCRIFPRTNYFGIFPYSKLFFKILRWEIKNNRVLIHIPVLHKVFNIIIVLLIKKVPLISHQTGGANALWRFKKNKKIKSLVFSFFERKIFF